MRRQERRAGLDILKMSAAHVSFILNYIKSILNLRRGTAGSIKNILEKGDVEIQNEGTANLLTIQYSNESNKANCYTQSFLHVIKIYFQS